jgi:deoxyribonucleoside regulator
MNEDSHQINSLIQVARLYYEDGLSQQEIADRMGVSRSLIALYLKRAHDLAIVRIQIADPRETCNSELASIVQEKLHVENVCVVPGVQSSAALARRSLSAAVARFMENSFKDGDVVGFSWGRTIMEIASLLAPRKPAKIDVVPLLGESATIIGTYSQVNQIVQQIAQSFSGNPRYLLAPLLVGSKELGAALFQDEIVQKIDHLWEKLDYACVGIGSIPPSAGQIVYLGEEKLASFQQAGAVGDIVARYFDIHGNYIPLDLHERVIGIRIEQLRKTEHVLAVASETEKARAVIGVTRSNLITDLFIGEALAEEILEELKEE